MKKIITLALLLNFVFAHGFAFAEAVSEKNLKHPRYYEIFINQDKYEKFNRKVFNFNLKMNKIFVKNLHIVWDSIFPAFLIDAINRAYYNIEYPKRLVSAIFQRDLDAIKNETKRFIINTTIGVGGLFDSAFKFFNLEMYDEDMEQAFAKCKIKSGSYLVLPFISSTNTRDIFGRIIDFLLTPTTYFMAPVAAAIKTALLINRTEFIQPVIKMVESNFADPYDIARKFFGVQKQIKLSNYDRKNVLEKNKDDFDDELELVDKKNTEEHLEVKGKIENEHKITSDINQELTADIYLSDYKAQNPILDSMRTALFDIKNENKHFWKEYSIWNRDFSKKLKIDFVEITQNKPKYAFKYILQKEKSSPLVIIFPSVGEGISSNHSAILGSIFYKKGYSVLILGNYFQWEFLKSLDDNYKLGNINEDIKYINKLVNKAIIKLSSKYDRIFLKRTAIGTSLGAYAVLYLGNKQYQDGAGNIDNFIAICPPYDLFYAIDKLDKIMSSWQKYPGDLKNKIALTTAKVMRAYKEKNLNKSETLPFSKYEAELISGYLFHQKLSDIVFQIEKSKKNGLKESEIYENIYTINFNDYMSKYLSGNNENELLKKINNMNSISDYLINSDNYRIYHSLDDYLISNSQLKTLKEKCENKLKIFSNGAHLGFLYRDEFKNELSNEIDEILKSYKH